LVVKEPFALLEGPALPARMLAAATELFKRLAEELPPATGPSIPSDELGAEPRKEVEAALRTCLRTAEVTALISL
jgi:hypothetical protein